MTIMLFAKEKVNPDLFEFQPGCIHVGIFALHVRAMSLFFNPDATVLEFCPPRVLKLFSKKQTVILVMQSGRCF